MKELDCKRWSCRIYIQGPDAVLLLGGIILGIYPLGSAATFNFGAFLDLRGKMHRKPTAT